MGYHSQIHDSPAGCNERLLLNHQRLDPFARHCCVVKCHAAKSRDGHQRR
jgi:hypothetical protein